MSAMRLKSIELFRFRCHVSVLGRHVISEAVDDRSSVIVAVGDVDRTGIEGQPIPSRSRQTIFVEPQPIEEVSVRCKHFDRAGQQEGLMSMDTVRVAYRDDDGSLIFIGSESEYDQRSPAGIVKAIIPTLRQQNPFSSGKPRAAQTRP